MTTVEGPDVDTVTPQSAARRDPGPDAPVTPATAWRWVVPVTTVLALVVGLAAMLVAGLVAVAPVDSSVSTLSWPAAGEAPTSTTAFLVPYRPATLDAAVPCTAIRDATGRTGPATVLATTLGGATQGLVVRAERGALQVLANGRSVPVTVPAGDACGLAVHADAAGLTLRFGTAAPVVLAGDPVPQVFAVRTDLTGPVIDGLALRARTPSWFDNAATPEKDALVVLQLQLATVALGLLVVLGVLRAAGDVRPRLPSRAELWPTGEVVRARADATLRRCAQVAHRVRPTPVARVVGRLAVDGVVLVGLAWWSIVGPLTDDDGFASVIAQRAGDGEEFGNYYRWYNASESPFASLQHVLQWFFGQGLSPLALRTTAVLAGLLTWVILSRGVLRPALGRVGRTVTVRVLAALALAAWWLPYDMGTRPEPLVALGTTVVLALVLRAVGKSTRHPLPLLGAAAVAASVTVTVAPSGLLVLAPVILCLPRVWRLLRGENLLALVAHLALIGGLAAVAITVVFADQSWHGLMVSTVIHDVIGPSQPWYAEWLRYGYLFGDEEWGSATKRVPVLLGLVLSVPAVVLLARRGRDLLGPESTVLLGLLPVGLVLLAATPSKWSHHFGSLAGYGAVFVPAVLVALARTAGEGSHARRNGSAPPGPSRAPDPAVWVIGGLSTVAVCLAAAFSFSGPNAWRAYSNIGMPNATGPVHPFDEPLLWLGLALGLIVLLAPVAVIARRVRGGSARIRVATLVPAGLTVAALVTTVGVLVTSFSAAADRGPGLWSLAEQNRASITAPGSAEACGLQNRIQVLTTAADGALSPEPRSTADLQGFAAGADGLDDAPPSRPDQTDANRDGRFSWGSQLAKDAASVGSMTTPWFPLARPDAGQELATSVSGRTDRGASVTWEFARGDTVLGTRRVVEPPEPERGYRGYVVDPEQARLQDQAYVRPGWRTVTVAPADIPAGTDRVRLQATDERSDASGWVALTGPRIVDITPLSRYLADRAPVLVDWTIAFAWPCQLTYPRVARGVAATPETIISTPDGPADSTPGLRISASGTGDYVVGERWTLGTLGIVTGLSAGGSFGGVSQTGTMRAADTRLAGEPGRRWGKVLVVDYGGLGLDRYDLGVTTTRIPGTDGDPPPVREPEPTFTDPGP